MKILFFHTTLSDIEIMNQYCLGMRDQIYMSINKQFSKDLI